MRTATFRTYALAIFVGWWLTACAPGAAGQPGPGASTSSSATPATGQISIAAPAGSVEAQIQQVILKGNSEQEQAIASHDSSVMQDTSTDSYYQELSQANQSMIDSGVTAIKLIKIEWGAVTVTGSTASASTYETWITDYADGSTTQSRDRNLYTLVLEGGSWKVQKDEHPDEGLTTSPSASPSASASASGSVSPSPQVTPAEISPSGQSQNWAGYEATGGSFTGVTGTWTVPTPSTNGGLGADAAWVGVGGVRSSDLIQAGTQETVIGSGRIQYQTWIETLPQASIQVPLVVHGGDSVTVSLSRQEGSQWLIAMKNNTTGLNYDRTVQYDSSLSSAEWVEEAPTAGRGVLPLTSFGTIAFSNASAIKDGKSVNLAQAGAQAITMINRSGQLLAIPSTLTNNGTGFSVTRTTNSSTGFGRGFPRQPVPVPVF